MLSRGREIAWGARTYVMGIVNVTPDSFSGDGITDVARAVDHAIAQSRGADVLDIGAESTRPDYTPVDEATERARLLPVLTRVRELLPGAPISVDTYKANILRDAVDAGADMLNSVWGLPDDLLDAAVECGVPVVVMHNQHGTAYDGEVMDTVLRFLLDAAERAVNRGLKREHIVLDPGIGFGKTPEHNLRVLGELPRLVALGFPTMIGTSRKSTIGKLTGKPPEQRVAGTTATTALAVAAGIDMVRVHDVDAALDAVRVSDAIVRGWRPDGWT